MAKHLCPWWLAYTFDNPLRRIFHNPEKIFIPYLKNGMSAVDIGCGMGYFSIGMAKIVGDAGKVISIDVQQKMLDILMKRANKAGVSDRITPILCDEKNIGISEKVDFALMFWMTHETPDEFNLLKQVHSVLYRSGKLFLAEPKMHVTSTQFKKTLYLAQESGFIKTDSPKIYLSRGAVFEKQ